MRALNPFTGEFYRETLKVCRYTREMFCLMEGRHVHPSTLYPGGVGTVATIQLFTDYCTRLMRYVEFMKRVVPMHDDLFDFMYEALPGYEEVGRRRVMLGLWGAFNDPEHCDFDYKTMIELGTQDVRHPRASSSTASSSPPTWSRSTSASGSCWAARSTGTGRTRRSSSTATRSATRSRCDHPWNQHTIPAPQKRDFDDKYSWTMSPRWFDGTDHLAMDTGGGPLARLWVTALAGLVDAGGYVRSTGHSVEINLPRTVLEARDDVRRGPRRSTSRAGRCPTPSSATAPAPTSRPTRPRRALHFIEKALAEVRGGNTKTWETFVVPGRVGQRRLHRGRARRALATTW